MKYFVLALLVALSMFSGLTASASVDTGQDYCYSEQNQAIPCPQPGEPLFGQDANYRTTAPAYEDNGDGTITDLNTGLMWQKTPGVKVSWDDAMANAASQNTGGYTDWRLPTIKELYSLMDFNGVVAPTEEASTPFIDRTYFEFEYGDLSAGERLIDAQYWSSTLYVSTTMQNNETAFGVNFADGRIKGYGTEALRPNDLRFVRYVRGESTYGVNDFVDNGDGTITDQNSGLMWMQDDSAGGFTWANALAWCENSTVASYDDWRLPDAKELQAIVDYTRSPDTTNSAAIDPIFNASPIQDSEGNPDYPYYWTSTTHLDGPDFAVYVAFGEADGYMQLQGATDYTLLDVHGAGAQRSDPKSGDPADHPVGNGPQGDVIRIYNYARCVRGGEYEIFTGGSTEGAPLPATNLGNNPAGGQQGQQGQGSQPTGQPGQQGGQGQPGQPPQGGQQTGGQQGGMPPQPPQEAITACQGLTEGATCSFTTPNGTVNGTCATIQEQLACKP